MSSELLGPTYALATALTWASAVILFKKSGEGLEPVALNYFKNVVGLALIVLTLWLTATPIMEALGRRDLLILLASGAVGIGVADTLFFRSLNILGASRSAVVDCLYSPFVVLFSIALLHERVSFAHAAGGALIVVSVLVSAHGGRTFIAPHELWRGLGYGVLAMAMTAWSIVTAKPVLEHQAVLVSTSVRLVGGLTVLTLLTLVHAPSRRQALKALLPQSAWRVALPGAILGTYLTLIFWSAGFKYASASVASILNQTSTVLVVLLAAFFLRERLTRKNVVAAMLAFMGSILVLV